MSSDFEENDSGCRIIRTRIEPESEGMRLDHYLAARFTYRSRTEWQKVIHAGEITINGHVARSSRPLHENDLVEYLFTITEEPPVDTNWSVLLERPEFLLINKPSPLPVHPSGRFFQHTLQMLMKKQFGNPVPINRLDRETSGIVLFAKDPKFASELGIMIQDRAVEKHYSVIVHGKFPEGTTAKKGFLFSDPESPVRKKRRFSEQPPPDGIENETCDTVFTLLGTDGTLSVLDCELHTGRLHQIRATLCSSGYPVVGDKLYGVDDTMFLRQMDDALTDDDRQRLILPCQALHARTLAFQNPFRDEKIFCEAQASFAFSGLQDRIFGV